LTTVAEVTQKDERFEANYVTAERRPFWFLAVIYLSLAVAITWPAALSPLQTVPGTSRTDLWNSLWSLWFVQDSVISGVIPFDVPWLDWPHVGQLVVADPLNALLGLPFVTVFGLSGGYTFIVLAHITFTGVSTHLLARHIYGCDSSGWIGGVAFATAPVLISGIQNGTSESFAGGWLALSLYAVILAVEIGGLRRILTAALTLCLVCLGGWYTGVGAWIFLVAISVFGLANVSRLKSIKRGLIIGLLALTVVGPIDDYISRDWR
jgi:hypothetical protein